MSTTHWSTYLSAQGWVILDENNEMLLNTGSDDIGPQVAEIVRRYNAVTNALTRLLQRPT